MIRNRIVDESEVIRQMREHLEGLFPKHCRNCGRRFDTLRDYLLITTHLGSTMPYDAMMGNWRPINPIGMVTLANCPCGNTLSLTSKGMPRRQLWALMGWAKNETKRRHMTPQELLNYLRDQLCMQILSEPNQQS